MLLRQRDLTRTLRQVTLAVAWGCSTALHAADTVTTELAAVTTERQAGAPGFGTGHTEESKPFEFGATYKGDVLAGVSGYWKKGAYLGNLDLKLTVAGEQVFKLPGSTLFLHVLNNHGGKPNLQVGATQGVDNIEVELNTTKLLQAWYQQQFLRDRLSLLVGLYDLNAEFYVTPASGLFIHPSFGIGAELAQTGQNGPSIFPATSVGVRTRWQATPQWYGQAVVLDGVSGDPRDGHGTQVRFDDGDGVLAVLEAGYESIGEDETAKLALGTWRYSAQFDDLRDTDASGRARQRTNAGFYALAQRLLYRKAGDAQRRLDGFLRLGTANADINQLDFSLALGAVYVGPLASRPEDSLGFAISAAQNGAKFREISRANGGVYPRWEIAYELTYRSQLNSWLALQPTIEYIASRGDSGVRDSTLVGLRFEANY